MKKIPEHVAIVLDAGSSADEAPRDAQPAHLEKKSLEHSLIAARIVLDAALESGVRQLTLCIENAAGTLDTAAAIRLAAALRRDIDTSERRGLEVRIAQRSGRHDLVAATQKLAREVQTGALHPDDVSLELVQKYLHSAAAADPDLIILCGRQDSGAPQRLSGCLLFESAYAEFHFCQATAAAFTRLDWQRALADFSQRDRRFGRTPDVEKPATRFSAPQESAAVLP